MKHSEIKNRIIELEEKFKKIKIKLKEAQLKEDEIRRKRETQRKIVMGGIVMREIAEGNKEAENIFLNGLKKSSVKTQEIFPEYLNVAS